MQIDEFKKTKWRPKMKAIYKGSEYPIGAIDFDEALIGLDGYYLGTDDVTWVRCENIELVIE